MAMRTIFFVVPVGLDPRFSIKRQIALDIVGENALIPPLRQQEPVADFRIDLAVQTLQQVTLLIADLSFERPSCYFELGMAQALGIRTFIMAESGTRLHQHAGDVSFYSDLEQYRNLIRIAVR